MKTRQHSIQSNRLPICGMIIIVTIFISSFTLSAQFPGWTNYTAGNHVTGLAREGDLIWVGSWAGLTSVNRITGVQTCYNHANSGLPINSVYALAVDQAGNKWLATSYKGLVKFDGSAWTSYNTGNSGLPSDNLTAVAVDASGDIWVGTGNSGIAKFNGTTWTIYTQYNSGLSSDNVRAIYVDANDNKWISTALGVSKFNGTTWTVYNGSGGIPTDHVQNVTLDNQGNLWMTLWWSGIAKYDGSVWTYYTWQNSGLPIGGNIDIAVDANNVKWITTEISGLIRFDDVTWTIYKQQNSPVISDEIRDILIDENGVKWLGAGTCQHGVCTNETGGLQKYDGTNWTVYPTGNSGIADDLMNDIVIENGGIKWVGTHQGVVRYDGSTWTLYNQANSPLPTTWINSIAVQGNGDVWAGINYSGVARFHQGTWNIYNTGNSALPTNFINCIGFDQAGNTWIGTNQGLTRFNGTTWQHYTTSNSGLPNNDIQGLSTDHLGNLWIGTNGGGLVKYNGITWSVFNTSNSGIPSNGINTIVFDRTHVLWAITGNYGLIKYDGTNWQYFNYGNSGLPDNLSGALAVDSLNNIWIGSNVFWGHGLTKYDGSIWTNYNVDNSGLSHTPSAIAVDSLGHKWIATWSGLVEFDEIGTTSVAITSVGSTNLVCNGIPTGSISVAATGGIAPLQFSINNGLTWVANGGSFSNLPAGTYFIKVKDVASNIITFSGNPVVVTQPPSIIISWVDVINVNCYQGNNGMIYVAAHGGTGLLFYSIDNGATWHANNGYFTDLTAGIYTVKVKDANGCEIGYSGNQIVIPQPPEIVVLAIDIKDVKCNGQSNGIIDVKASGGTGMLRYSADNGATWHFNDGLFIGLSPGEYDIVVLDDMLCLKYYDQNPVLISEPPVLIVDEVLHTNVTVTGGSNGTINITASGGTGPISYSINDGSTWSTENLFSGLPAGSYKVAVKDTSRCIAIYPQNPVIILEPGVGTEADDQLQDLIVFPNPFTEEVCFSFTAALAGISEIELFDALGSKIAATVIREISNGKSRVIIVGRNLTPGIYFYKVTAGKSVKSGKLIKW